MTSNKKPPEIIEFPAPKQIPPHPELAPKRLVYPLPKPTVDPMLRDYIASCIARTLYRVAQWPEAEIVTMSEQEFDAFCRDVLAEEDA